MSKVSGAFLQHVLSLKLYFQDQVAFYWEAGGQINPQESENHDALHLENLELISKPQS